MSAHDLIHACVKSGKRTRLSLCARTLESSIMPHQNKEDVANWSYFVKASHLHPLIVALFQCCRLALGPRGLLEHRGRQLLRKHAQIMHSFCLTRVPLVCRHARIHVFVRSCDSRGAPASVGMHLQLLLLGAFVHNAPALEQVSRAAPAQPQHPSAAPHCSSENGPLCRARNASHHPRHQDTPRQGLCRMPVVHSVHFRMTIINFAPVQKFAKQAEEREGGATGEGFFTPSPGHTGRRFRPVLH